MPRPRILVVGSANLDLVVRTPRLPTPGETLLGATFHRVHGGKGANQAVACARLGAETWLLGRVGADSFGDELLAGLQAAGVRTDCVRRCPDTPTGVAFILVQAGGENSIVVAPGANMAGRAEDLAAAPDLDYFDAVLLQLEVPLPLLEAALREAGRCGVLTVLDAGPPTPQAAPLIPLAAVLSPNRTETEALLGLSPDQPWDPAAAAGELLARGARQVVMKLGSEGALLAEAGRREQVPALPVEVVDTTGAGDAFTAALTVTLAQGADLPTATRLATVAGALACTVLGAQPSMPDRAALQRLAAAQGLTLPPLGD